MPETPDAMPERDQTSDAAPRTEAPAQPRTGPSGPGSLQPWKVLLHNDDVNDRVFVVNTIVSLTPLDESDAVNRMLEAERQGVSLLLTTHQERAELYVQQFGGCNLTVTAEPA